MDRLNAATFVVVTPITVKQSKTVGSAVGKLIGVPVVQGEVNAARVLAIVVDDSGCVAGIFSVNPGH